MESVLSSEDHEEWDAQVVKEGYMFVKRPPGHKWNKIWVRSKTAVEMFSHLQFQQIPSVLLCKFKAWHRRYFVITDCSRECSSQLVMYSSHQASKLRLPPILRLALHQTVHLGIMSHSQRFPKVLVIVVSDMSPLLLASEDESGVLWVSFCHPQLMLLLTRLFRCPLHVLFDCSCFFSYYFVLQVIVPLN